MKTDQSKLASSHTKLHFVICEISLQPTTMKTDQSKLHFVIYKATLRLEHQLVTKTLTADYKTSIVAEHSSDKSEHPQAQGAHTRQSMALLLNCMVDVFGKTLQPPASVEASEITDIIDFLHHAVLYEGQGGPVQSSSKPKPETLTLCAKVMDMLRPDVQHLLSHLKTDPNSSVYAATHPKLVQNPS
ncbi:hypothetical protein Taro_009955 [Colocasia esculenta]|uniref:Uncharacterized protein n=1 Tax=Colocasia esculenta TaxID=4460 RepID=A0A843U5L4_COLES|nr:hypothetical protein [Colocasia esculenta]